MLQIRAFASEVAHHNERPVFEDFLKYKAFVRIVNDTKDPQITP